MDGVSVQETEPWEEEGETWRVLRAYFPGSIETSSLVQDFFFIKDLELRRHDYHVNIAGGFAASQLTSGYIVADGIHLPTRRCAYTRPRSPANPRYANGVDRHHRCMFQVNRAIIP
jgi:hypothetical protein